MATKAKIQSRGEKEKRDRALTSMKGVPTVPAYDGEFSVGGRRVLAQEGSVLPVSKSIKEKDTLRQELSDKLIHDRAHYPVYVYALASQGSVAEPHFEVPRAKFCYQIFDEIAAHLPYHVLGAGELNTALRITPRLFSPNAIGVWDELEWAEQEFLVDKNANPERALPLALQAAMTKYVLDPVKYADEKYKVIESLKANPDDRAKHMTELKKLQFGLMDYFEPSLLADVVQEIMSYNVKKK